MGSGAGLELVGILQTLAGFTPNGAAPDDCYCANAPWAPINGNGAKPSSLVTDGVPGQSVIGALNYKNGTVGLGLNLVCNQLAGTAGLEAQLALRVYAGLQ